MRLYVCVELVMFGVFNVKLFVCAWLRSEFGVWCLRFELVMWLVVVMLWVTWLF